MDDVKHAERETAWKLFLSGAITVVLWAIIGAAIVAMATGCTHTLQNDGEVGFKYSTSFAFFHTAKKTTGSGEADVAKSNTEFPALVEWFLEGPPPPPPDTPPPK